MHVPLTNLFEPNQKFQEAILSIKITALTWFGAWASICAGGGGIHMGVWGWGKMVFLRDIQYARSMFPALLQCLLDVSHVHVVDP